MVLFHSSKLRPVTFVKFFAFHVSFSFVSQWKNAFTPTKEVDLSADQARQLTVPLRTVTTLSTPLISAESSANKLDLNDSQSIFDNLNCDAAVASGYFAWTLWI